MSIDSRYTASGLSWVLRHENERRVLAMAQIHGISEMLARILVGREVAVEDVPLFLQPTLRASLPDPFHLIDMDKAVARLVKAIGARERMAVFGDYDVDGATSSSLLFDYFSALGRPLDIYIPDRLKEGYGPTITAFDTLINRGATLIITVDCGTLSHDPIAHAAARGVDVIVLDHHLSTGALPPACAIVNPNRVDESSPHRNLAAVGVTFLFLVALTKRMKEEAVNQIPNPQSPIPDLLDFLDRVALGTVCDVMPLTGLNRAFVTQGLKVLRQRHHAGLAALADRARLDETPNVYHLGFLLGPRINAGGRVGEANLGIRLLTSADENERIELAARLDQLNAERQAIEASITEEAMAIAASQANAPVIVVTKEGWHAGVIGIVAARLKEQFARPAAVIALEGEVGKGSARSVVGADIGAAVHAAHTHRLLLAGGGHAMAAGFSLSKSQIPAFQNFLCERLSRAVSEYQEARVKKLDGWVTVGGATFALLEDIERAGPFGVGNSSPRLGLRHVRILHRDVMKEKHIRLTLCDDAGSQRLTAVAFHAVGNRLGEWLLTERNLHVFGELKRNRWQGRDTVQLIIEDAAKTS